MTTSTTAPTNDIEQLDAVVIGAGIAGLYQLHKLREMGLKVRAYESGSGVGGTWYWNRYPGCRFDSASEVYKYWFSEELYQSWSSTERFPAQPETEAWLNHVADKLDLKKDIVFNAPVASAQYDEESGRWLVTTTSGQTVDTQYIVACCGMLSAPLTEHFEGQSSFRGTVVHPARWPKDGIDVKGKRVAIVGTGATGVQLIQSMTPQCSALKVFVRTPPYIIPMRNPKYGEAEWEQFSARYEEFKQVIPTTFGGFDFDFKYPPFAELTDAQRLEIMENHWQEGSLSFWLGTFPELFADEEVNAYVGNFVREKMRDRLKDRPDLWDLLIPTDYYGTRRVTLEDHYLECFLNEHVQGINCRDNPIQRIVPEGIQTADGQVHEVDVIILAVGFDGGSGALSRIDIRGRDNRSLKEEWSRDIRTAMGLQVYGYPNLFTTGAPLAPAAALCNMPSCLQEQVNWVSDCISHMAEQGKTVIEASEALQDSWVTHHDETTAQSLYAKADSWYNGANIPGKPRRMLSYVGGAGNYNQHCADVAKQGYPGFLIN